MVCGYYVYFSIYIEQGPCRVFSANLFHCRYITKKQENYRYCEGFDLDHEYN